MSQPKASPALPEERDLTRRVINFLHVRGVRTESIDVDADGGVVFVRGKTSSPESKARFLGCCRRVAGVREVVDQLQDGDQ